MKDNGITIHCMERRTEYDFEKKKVYVTGSRSKLDSEQIFQIGKEILQVYDCKVYYDADIVYFSHTTPRSFQSRTAFLKQMDMTVFVVSEDFLGEEESGEETEFQYVRDNNLPFLGIALSPKLNQWFDDICGSYQLLDYTAGDYGKRLKSFFERKFERYSSVDKSPLELEDCFLSSMFISYRKKNRVFADKLIGVLNSLEICRNISLWFDDFLTEGESYNREIDACLKNSDIVILLVTPEIIETMPDGQDNYVVRIEYPNAVKAGKIIIPVLAADTDKEILKEKFPGLGTGISLDDKEELEKVIRQALKTLGKDRIVSTPRQKYLLGCAYTDGQDIQSRSGMHLYRLPERGRKLLTEAAEEGSFSAMYKIGNILAQKGKYSEAVAWLVKANCFFKEAYDTEFSFENAIAYINSLDRLIDMHIAVEKWDEAKNLIQEYTRVIKENNAHGLYPTTKHNPGTAGKRLGDICFYQGNMITAVRYYLGAEQWILTYEEQKETPAALWKSMELSYAESKAYLQIWKTEGRTEELHLSYQTLIAAGKRAKKLLFSYGKEEVDEYYYLILEHFGSVAEEMNKAFKMYRDEQCAVVVIDIYETLLNLYEELYRKEKKVFQLENMGVYAYLSAVYGKIQPDRKMLTKSYDIWELLCRVDPDSERYRVMKNRVMMLLSL